MIRSMSSGGLTNLIRTKAFRMLSYVVRPCQLEYMHYAFIKSFYMFIVQIVHDFISYFTLQFRKEFSKGSNTLNTIIVQLKTNRWNKMLNYAVSSTIQLQYSSRTITIQWWLIWLTSCPLYLDWRSLSLPPDKVRQENNLLKSKYPPHRSSVEYGSEGLFRNMWYNISIDMISNYEYARYRDVMWTQSLPNCDAMTQWLSSNVISPLTSPTLTS